MKKLILTLAFLFVATIALADVYVNGYYRNNGTYVQPHWRSSPNSSTTDNWSSTGNVNPYTGQRGTRQSNPYSSSGMSKPSHTGLNYGGPLLR
jgi:hypothetical protein